MGKDAKNRATARRTASEKRAKNGRTASPRVACPKRSDSGERRELGKHGERTHAVLPFFLRLFRMLFWSAPLPYSSRLSPLTERLEQPTPRVFSLAFPSSRLSPLSKRLEQGILDYAVQTGTFYTHSVVIGHDASRSTYYRYRCTAHAV